MTKLTKDDLMKLDLLTRMTDLSNRVDHIASLVIAIQGYMDYFKVDKKRYLDDVVSAFITSVNGGKYFVAGTEQDITTRLQKLNDDLVRDLFEVEE
jgi:hypothetical protein